MKNMTMREKINLLNYHTELYNQGKSIWSDKEWDEMYFALKKEEEESGITYPDSPTQTIHYNLVDKILKICHEHPMLSLDKTKDLKEIENFLHGQPFVAMFKMDGITCSLTYENGNLVRAETRGNGIEGEDIFHNIIAIRNIPLTIPYKDRLVVDGEIICRKDDFEDFQKDYKNPRNFAAGSIRLLDSKECSKRKLTFVAWDLIEGYPEFNEFWTRLAKLKFLGFTIVPYTVQKKTPEEAIKALKTQCYEELLIYPTDGFVFKFDDVEYGKAQGQTEHHFKNAIAYKLYDETYETKVKDIEWTMGRTGQLTPVLIYNDIEIDGTVCNRANLHNITVMTQLMGEAYPGQQVFIYKANQIIPQVDSAQTDNPNNIPFIQIPTKCPYCGKPTEIKQDFDSKILYCINPNCDGKLINKLDHFFGIKGLNAKGISKLTFQRLIEWGWINNILDVFNLSQYKEEWIKKSGFGKLSVEKILNAIEQSKYTSLGLFLAAIGIPHIGKGAAKEIAKIFKTYDDFKAAVNNYNYHFYNIPNFGNDAEYNLKSFNYVEADKIAKLLFFKPKDETAIEVKDISLKGLNIAVTGKLQYFKNRKNLNNYIIEHGGEVSENVTKKTNILITNDIRNISEKLKKALDLKILIMSERAFIGKYIENFKNF